jgi:hypothetical protein
LNKIPAEIRITIFELALYRPAGLHVNLGGAYEGPPRCHVCRAEGRQICFHNEVAHGPALGLTCKQLYNEARPILFSVNTWILSTRNFNCPSCLERERREDLTRWLNEIVRDNMHDIKHIVIDLFERGWWGMDPDDSEMQQWSHAFREVVSWLPLNRARFSLMLGTISVPVRDQVMRYQPYRPSIDQYRGRFEEVAVEEYYSKSVDMAAQEAASICPMKTGSEDDGYDSMSDDNEEEEEFELWSYAHMASLHPRYFDNEDDHNTTNSNEDEETRK